MMKQLALAVVMFLVALPLAAQTQLGVSLFEQGRYEEAKRALSTDKNDPQALTTLGRIALVQNDYDSATDLFEKAVAKKPNDAEAHYWLGEAYGSQAQQANLFKQASLASKTKAEWERAVQLDPNHIEARMSLVEFYLIAPGIMGGSDEKAKQEASEIRKRDSFAGHRAFARIYSHAKSNDLARKEYLDAVREQPNVPKTHYWLGLLYLTEKNFKASLEEMDAALKIDPGYMPAVFQVGHLAVLSSSNFTRGEEALKRYLAYKPKSDEPPIGRAYYWLGGIYEKQGKRAEARQNYTIALKMNPKSNDVAEALKRVS
jgi:tetratricopeptide (TPR) repeat protein